MRMAGTQAICKRRSRATFMRRAARNLPPSRKSRQIGDARRSTIDLYIWIDRKQRRVTAWIQGNASAEHDATIKALFLPEMRKARSPDKPTIPVVPAPSKMAER